MNKLLKDEILAGLYEWDEYDVFCYYEPSYDVYEFGYGKYKWGVPRGIMHEQINVTDFVYGLVFDWRLSGEEMGNE